MSLIDRDEVYKVLSDYYHHRTDAQHNALKEALDRVPSAEKKGKWTVHGKPPMYVIECSSCGQKFFNHVGQSLAKYCSNCGAKMEVTE